MPWSQKTVDGLSCLILSPEETGGETSVWEAKVWQMLTEACATQADRNSMSYGAGEPFADASDLTLTNAIVEGGYARNTVQVGVLGENIATDSTKATTNSYYNQPAPNACDGNATTRWLSNATSVCWFQYDCTVVSDVLAYAMTIDAEVLAYTGTMSWQVQGSNTGADGSWSTIETQTAQAFTANTRRVFSFATKQSYRYYRLNFTASTGGYIGINVFELLGVYSSSIPTMTAATTSGVTFSASTTNGTWYPWYAGDRGANIWSSTAVTNEWLKVAYSAPQKAKRYSISVNTSLGGSYPTAWVVQGSTDSAFTSPVTLDSRTGQTFSGTLKNNYDFTSEVTYQYYRILFSAASGSNINVCEFDILSDQSTGAINAATIDLKSVPLTLQGFLTAGESWTTGAILPMGTLRNAAFVRIDDYVYIVGGYTGSAGLGSVYRKSLTDFVAGTGSWVANGTLPTATMYNASVVVYGTNIYIVGGYSTAGFAYVYKKSLTNFIAGTGSWTTNGTLPTAVMWAAATVIIDSYVYIIGGTNGTTSYSTVARKSVADFVAGTGSWVANGSLPTSAMLLASAVVSGPYIYIIGGYDGTNHYANVKRKKLTDFVAGTGSWSNYGDLPTTNMSCAASAIIDTNIYIVGGYNGTSYYTNSYRKTLGTSLNATAGKIIFTGYNADATAMLDVGNSGSNKIEVYPLLDDIPSSAVAFTYESLGNNKWRFTSAEISLANVVSFGARIMSFLRTVAPNFRLYEALLVWR